jgi:sarcosine oxidase subunit gamma
MAETVIFRGLVTIEEAGAQGMIALRGEIGGAAIAAALGRPAPGVRRIEDGVAWMSPDELLVMVPAHEAAARAAGIEAALAGEFALVADVSDARVVFRLRGAGWREVLARLSPVDFAPHAFGPGDFRRTRAAQVAAAVWCEAPDVACITGFRSVAGYLRDLLCNAADPAGETGLYTAHGVKQSGAGG